MLKFEKKYILNLTKISENWTKLEIYWLIESDQTYRNLTLICLELSKFQKYCQNWGYLAQSYKKSPVLGKIYLLN